MLSILKILGTEKPLDKLRVKDRPPGILIESLLFEGILSEKIKARIEIQKPPSIPSAEVLVTSFAH